VGQTTKNFGIVIAVIVIMGLFIFALDSGLYALLGLVMGTGSAA
jgi:preprotein translocase subunit SecE